MLPPSAGPRQRGALPSFWLAADPYTPAPSLARTIVADVAIVGAGFTGLWTAIELKTRRPALAVVVLEAAVVGYGASGRNGGFLDCSLTHGLANGLRHFPDEIDELQRLGRENLAAMVAFLAAHDVRCDYEPVGTLAVATEPYQVAEQHAAAEALAAHGEAVRLLDAAAVRAELDSPLFLGALHRPESGGLLNPARLVRGLARVAQELGVELYASSPVTGLRAAFGGVHVDVGGTPAGQVRAAQVVLATNAYSGPLWRPTRPAFVPVYDYVLVSAPLTAAQRQAIGWANRQGVADSGNRFHYFRLTADDRILWGGFDAVHHYGSRVGPAFDHRLQTFARLQRHFVATFPQLRELAFPYRWGGPIATTTRFTATFGRGMGGRLHYALGYTGLGVGATRFAARVLADQLLAPDSPLLQLRYVRRHPFPFPPEPLRSAAIAGVQRALRHADEHDGRRGLLLRTLDHLGIGFDS